MDSAPCERGHKSLIKCDSLTPELVGHLFTISEYNKIVTTLETVVSHFGMTTHVFLKLDGPSFLRDPLFCTELTKLKSLGSTKELFLIAKGSVSSAGLLLFF